MHSWLCLNEFSNFWSHVLLLNNFFCLPDFFEQFYGKYGSFTPLSDTDILDHLNKTFQSDLNDRQV